MSRSLARRLLERDRALPRCGSCGQHAAGGLCDRCREELVAEIEDEEAEWWPAGEPVPAPEWWDDPDLDLPF